MFPPFQFRSPVCSSFPLIRFFKKNSSLSPASECMCGESRYVYEGYYAGKEEKRLRPAEGGGGRSRVVVGPTLS